MSDGNVSRSQRANELHASQPFQPLSSIHSESAPAVFQPKGVYPWQSLRERGGSENPEGLPQSPRRAPGLAGHRQGLSRHGPLPTAESRGSQYMARVYRAPANGQPPGRKSKRAGSRSHSATSSN